MTTEVRKLHFSIEAGVIVELTRQAFWLENRQKWALDTLRCYEGITEAQIEHILNGTATLENHMDGKRVVYKETPDIEWQEKLAKHLEWQESRTYLFASKRVPKDLVDHYVINVVQRLRDAMRSPNLMQVLDPQYLFNLEQQRKALHDEIFLAAGFSKDEIGERGKFEWSDEFNEFDKEFSAYLNKQTDWITGGE